MTKVVLRVQSTISIKYQLHVRTCTVLCNVMPESHDPGCYSHMIVEQCYVMLYLSHMIPAVIVT